MTTKARRTPKMLETRKAIDPYAQLDALCDPDDEATHEWIRTCSWSVEAKREFLLDERKHGLERAMASAQARQIDDLTSRLRKMEKAQAQFRNAAIDATAKALADFGRAEGFMVFRGTWDELADYARGSVVVNAGATWVAIAQASKGSRPGKAPEWKLTAKGDGT